MGGHLVRKFVKQTKIDSRFAVGLRVSPVSTKSRRSRQSPRKGQVIHRFWGKRMPLCRQKQPGFDLSDRVVDQGRELLPLLVGDGGPQVLDFYCALADEDDLRDVIDPADPGITNQLRIQGGYAVRFLGIAGRAGLPLQDARYAVQFSDRIDESDETIPRRQIACESNLLLGMRLENPDAPVLGEAFEQLSTVLKHVVPSVVSRVDQLQVLTGCPLLEQDCCRILMTE